MTSDIKDSLNKIIAEKNILKSATSGTLSSCGNISDFHVK